MKIEAADSADHLELSDLTKLSKAFWGYSDAQILAWDEDLTLSEAYFDNNHVYKAIDREKLIAYYSYGRENAHTVKLDNLFVHPEWIGKGIGQTLMSHFLNELANTNYKRIVLDADPHAEKFYLKLGFHTIDQLQSSVPGRFLPIMELKI